LFKGEKFLFCDVEKQLSDFLAFLEAQLVRFNEVVRDYAGHERSAKGERVQEIDIEGLKKAVDFSRAEKCATTWVNNVRTAARINMLDDDGQRNTHYWQMMRDRFGIEV
jgi:hypothetical protein